MFTENTARDLASSAIETALVFAPRSICVDYAIILYRRARRAWTQGDAVALYRDALICAGRALGQDVPLRDYYAALEAMTDHEAGIEKNAA
jgi:hypothetical protein